MCLRFGPFVARPVVPIKTDRWLLLIEILTTHRHGGRTPGSHALTHLCHNRCQQMSCSCASSRSTNFSDQHFDTIIVPKHAPRECTFGFTAPGFGVGISTHHAWALNRMVSLRLRSVIDRSSLVDFNLTIASISALDEWVDPENFKRAS